MSRPAPGRTELLGLWLGLALCTAAVLTTYARRDPAELYHVSESGLAGGLGRALVFLNFPVALIAAAVAVVAAAVSGRGWAIAVAAAVVASALAVPFVVHQDDLDARAANAVPAAGVVLALVLTALALSRPRVTAAPRRLAGDRLRLVLGVALLVVAVPWFFAELGYYAPDPILADEPSPGEDLAAVHLGHHHGTDGVILALAALALSRIPPRLPRLWARVASPYLALMLAYGLANAAQDAWFEQVVKRGTTSVELPRVLLPGLTVAWGCLLAVALLVELLWFRRER